MAAAAAAGVLAVTASLASAPPAHAITPGIHPLAVVLCKFTDKVDEPQTPQYYQDMFGSPGKGGVFDYWRDVSYGKLNLTGTTVVGSRWYTADQTVAQFLALGRNAKVDACASKAKVDVDFNQFAGVVVLTNQAGGTADLFGGEPPTTIGGTTYASLGSMLAEWDEGLDAIMHETGHAFGLKHSRTVRQQYDENGKTLNDYGDPYDVMSCRGCWGAQSAQSPYRGNHPPGLNVVQLDNNGWLPDEQTRPGTTLSFNNQGCGQKTITLAALNHPEATGYLHAQIFPGTYPADFGLNVPIQHATEQTTGVWYTVEFRHKSGWDDGIPKSQIVLHLAGLDGYSYWVDSSGNPGTYYNTTTDSYGVQTSPGSEYVDTAHNSYVAFNSMDSNAPTAKVTLASCKIKPTLKHTYTDEVITAPEHRITLAADLTVDGAPVPNQPVTLFADSLQCTSTTDSAGHAACQVINNYYGPVATGASFSGDNAYEAANVCIGCGSFGDGSSGVFYKSCSDTGSWDYFSLRCQAYRHELPELSTDAW